MAKKVVLFIVEGLSDKNALNPIISEIITDNNIHFDVTHGDITSTFNETIDLGIIEKIETIVNHYLTSRNFIVDDLLEVIFLTDTDGCFIENEFIKYHDDNIRYEDNAIFTRNVDKTIIRNILKTQRLDTLFKTKNIEIRNKIIALKTFYMSCNLDHVLFDERNMTLSKLDKANEFADSYENKEEEFISFLKQFIININHDYIKSWNEIKKKNNSLLRYSNLWLYLNKYK